MRILEFYHENEFRHFPLMESATLPVWATVLVDIRVCYGVVGDLCLDVTLTSIAKDGDEVILTFEAPGVDPAIVVVDLASADYPYGAAEWLECVVSAKTAMSLPEGITACSGVVRPEFVSGIRTNTPQLGLPHGDVRLSAGSRVYITQDDEEQTLYTGLLPADCRPCTSIHNINGAYPDKRGNVTLIGAGGVVVEVVNNVIYVKSEEAP